LVGDATVCAYGGPDRFGSSEPGTETSPGSARLPSPPPGPGAQPPCGWGQAAGLLEGSVPAHRGTGGQTRYSGAVKEFSPCYSINAFPPTLPEVCLFVILMEIMKNLTYSVPYNIYTCKTDWASCYGAYASRRLCKINVNIAMNAGGGVVTSECKK